MPSYSSVNEEGPRVLVADDTPAQRRMMSAIIEGIGWRAHAVTNGDAALAVSANARFEAIILDFNMPGTDGLETARGIRARGGWAAQAPIILVSAAMTAELARQARAIGVNACVRKPAQPREIADALFAAFSSPKALMCAQAPTGLDFRPPTVNADGQILEEEDMAEEAQIMDITGPLRVPRNMFSGAHGAPGAGSIHDDATASKLGFRGGTVAGSVHMDQFAPLLLSIYGDEFFEHGNLSLYFKNATVDAEPVRAFARRIGKEPQTRVWMEKEDGTMVAEGTASCGAPDMEGEVRKRLKTQKAGGDLRILGDCKVGDESSWVPVRQESSADGAERRQSNITEPLPAYQGKGKWAGKVVPIGSCVNVLRAAQGEILKRTGAVGLFGALEIQFVNGPVLADTDYLNQCKTLSLSESPKTENIWWEGELKDKSGKLIATHLQYLRFMKGSSPLWAEK